MDDNNKTFESQSPHFSMKICGGEKHLISLLNLNELEEYRRVYPERNVREILHVPLGLNFFLMF